MTNSFEDIAALWREFKRTGEVRLRNRLVEQYMPIVRYNAERIGAKLPQEVEHDDLVSAGIFGLLDAINAFDLDRGVKFETYCAPRIRGAILDELRNLDWVPRLVRHRAHMIDRAHVDLRYSLGREPTDSEVASRMKITLPEYRKLFREASAVLQVSLSRTYGETDSARDVCEIDMIVDRRSRDPIADAHRKDLRDLLTRGFTRAERLILVLYYYEHLTMKEIGEILDLSESRVSQMHSAIIHRLREQVAIRRREFAH